MKNRLLLSLLLFATALLYCSPATAGKNKPQCLNLLIDQCRQCHYLTRICAGLDKKDKGDWNRTIGYMVANGLKITKGQRGRILDCLVRKTPDVVGFCENPPPLSSMPPLKSPEGEINAP